MYCSSCGAEIGDGMAYCPACGEPTAHTADPAEERGVTRGEDYDFVMSLQDANNRLKLPRIVADVLVILATGGIWLGVMAAEYIYHHSQLKKGAREPFDEQKHKEEWFLWSVDDSPAGNR